MDREEVESRWGKIEDIRGAIIKLDLDIENPALEMNRIINEDDEAQLVKLEAASKEFIQEVEEIRANRDNEIKQIKVAINLIEEDADLKPYLKRVIKRLVLELK